MKTYLVERDLKLVHYDSFYAVIVNADSPEEALTHAILCHPDFANEDVTVKLLSLERGVVYQNIHYG